MRQNLAALILLLTISLHMTVDVMSDHHVYFIHPVGGGPIKIGCAKHPEGRLSALHSTSPYPLEFIARVPGGFFEETCLHQMFADERVHSEWFTPSHRLVSYIAKVAACGRLHGLPIIKANGGDKWIKHRLRDVRRRLGLSVRDYADGYGASPSLIHEHERNDRISQRILARHYFFAQSIDPSISIDDLYERDSEEAEKRSHSSQPRRPRTD